MQLFYNKADAYTFSDWLVPYALGVGVRDLNEFYLGGFPDLSSFLVRKGAACKVRGPIFQKYLRTRLTKFGKLLKKEMRGKIVIDLGCGIPAKSVVPRLFAEAMGAAKYVGVDCRNVQNETREGEFKISKSFQSQFYRKDALEFLKAFKRSQPLFVLLAGFEPTENSSGDVYLKKLTRVLHSKLKKGDCLILGAGTPNLNLSFEKFKNIYDDPYQEMFRRSSVH